MTKAKMIQTKGPHKGTIIYCDPDNTKFWEDEGFKFIQLVVVQ